jgi:hypothetical protein
VPRAPGLITARHVVERGGTEAARPAWRPSDVAMLAAIGMVASALRVAAPRDGDVFWGARSGLDTIRSGHIPHHDTYSWSVPGHSWIPSSWGWNVVLGAAYDAFGMAGFLVLALLMGALLGLVATLLARQVGAEPLPTAGAVAVLGAFVLGGTPRATALSTLLAPLVLLPLPRILNGSERWLQAMVGLVALQVLWINLHSGGLLGPVLIATFGVGFLARQDRRSRTPVALRLAGVVLLTALACLATPYGWALIAHAPKVRSASVGVIEEWHHYSAGSLLTPTGFAAAVVIVIAVLGLLRARRYDRLLPLLAVVVLAISAVRFTPIVLVLVLPELALVIGRLPIRALFLRATVGVIGLGLLVAAIGALADFDHVEELWGSPRLVHELPAGCRLFNDDVSGGTVILLRADVPVWIDGRNDMYGRTRTLRTLDVRDWEAGSARWIAAERITCVLVPKSDRLVANLTKVPGWRVADTDSTRTLLLRSALR